MNPVTLFLSTGRCGTQWLADALGEVYADEATVMHEPLGPRYMSSVCLRSKKSQDALRRTGEFQRHLARIREALEEGAYIETGWTVYGAVPVFQAEFGSALRLVHLVRHPVRVAASYMTHHYYCGDRDDGYTKWAALRPTDNVVQKEYVARWGEMTPFEKALFQWTEVNLYAESLRGRGPFHAVRYEELFAAETVPLEGLVRFCGLPYRPELAARRTERIDKFRRKTDAELPWEKVRDHRETLQLMQQYGYSLNEIRPDGMRRRYELTEMEVVVRIARRLLHAALKRVRRTTQRLWRRAGRS
jgi:hypothetical protein